MKRLATMFVMLAACGGGGGSTGDDDDQGTPDAGGSTVLVEGVPADQFYGQFSYAKTQTGVDGAAAFPVNSAGNNVYLAQVFMMPNGVLDLFYGEGEGEVDSTGWSVNIQTSTKKKRTGTWHVQGAQLVLDAFLTCDGLTYNGHPKLHCALAQTIVSPGALGKAGLFDKMIGAATPDDSEFAEYGP